MLMTGEEFLKKFQDMLQRLDPLNMEDKLEDLEEWDSLSMMATSAFFTANFRKEIPSGKMKDFILVKDLWEFSRN
jgi:hypothetical protein